MKNPYAVLLVAAFVVIFAIYSLVKRQKNMAALQTGEDMERLKEAIRKVLPGESGYKVA
ncbi:MAG: hypothetical protein J6C43_03705 [Oscillospiraceae bacterium]|nr:hypothetical protein [Oscillospiraceae bacterium]MBP3520509.1 hypothetical protein [Oscillospiraceae bacterium]